MAGQRCGQLHGHRYRGRTRPRGLGLALSLLLILPVACGEADGPDPFEPGTEQTGRSGGDAIETALVGTWRNAVIVQVPGDLQRWTTVWRFDADGGCRQTLEIESLSEGFPRITRRSCGYTTEGGRITITYLGAGTLSFTYFFAGFSPDRLVLDGFEYERLP